MHPVALCYSWLGCITAGIVLEAATEGSQNPRYCKDVLSRVQVKQKRLGTFCMQGQCSAGAMTSTPVEAAQITLCS